MGFTAVTGFVGSSPANLFNASSITYSLGPTLAQTFFDYGRRRGISEQTIANYDANVATYRQSVLDAYQQVEDNLVALTHASLVPRPTPAAPGHHRQHPQEAQQIFNNRYVGGVDTYLQVITAQTTPPLNKRAQRYRHHAPPHGRPPSF